MSFTKMSAIYVYCYVCIYTGILWCNFSFLLCYYAEYIMFWYLIDMS